MLFRDTVKVEENNHLFIGGIDCQSLAKEYGTPLYVMDQTHIEKMCGVYNNALKNNGINGKIFYASKAFSCKEIYRLAEKHGLGADIVSGGELFTAASVNFCPENIIFHGNNKTEREISDALEYGIGYFVIDSEEEATLIDKYAKEKGVIQKVLIRVNPGVEAHTHHYIQTAKIDSKFGFSISNGDAEEIINRVLKFKNLSLKGLHCHIGSQIFEKKSFEIAVDKMTDFYKLLKTEHGLSLEVLNLGGGFGIFYSEGDYDFGYSDYAEYINVICEKLKTNCKEKGLSIPYLMLEPGRSLVGEAGITLYTVGCVKRIKNVKNYAAIDGGMFDNPRFALYQAKYTVKNALEINPKGKTEIYTIAGKCCESGDIIAEDCVLPTLKRGDILAVFSTGAYNYSMASNYNRNTVPPVVFVKDGKARIVVKPQTYADLIKNDV